MYNIKSTLSNNIYWFPPGCSAIESGGWIFWTETQAEYFGPYATEKECFEKFLDYCKLLEEENAEQ